jgi:hypothetical protein
MDRKETNNGVKIFRRENIKHFILAYISLLTSSISFQWVYDKQLTIR